MSGSRKYPLDLVHLPKRNSVDMILPVYIGLELDLFTGSHYSVYQATHRTNNSDAFYRFKIRLSETALSF